MEDYGGLWMTVIGYAQAKASLTAAPNGATRPL